MDPKQVERASDGPASLKHKGVCNVRAGRGCFSSDNTCDKWHFSYHFDWTLIPTILLLLYEYNYM